jgi:hypothetical protein
MTEKRRTYLRKKVQIWWVKNDTAAHIGNMKMTLASMGLIMWSLVLGSKLVTTI